MKTTRILCIGMLIGIFGCKDVKKEGANEAGQTAQTETTMDTNGEDGWKVLFDGTSFEGWKGYLGAEVPDVWKIEDGAMVLYPPENRPEGAQYNLNTVAEFTDFTLSLEWRISEGGNSGVLWGIVEDQQFDQPYRTGPEIQVLDNERHPDAKVGGTTHQAGSLYDMVGPSVDVTKPVGEWNTMVITIDHKSEKGSVTLNGTELVTFPVGNDAWDAMVADSKFADWEGFAKSKSGKIGLQDHGDQVAFRNIKIKEL